MGTITRTHTFTAGEILTAGNLNGEIDGIISTVNGSIDAANVDTTAIPTLTATQTLTNKTLTSPKIGTSILDTGGNELLLLTATGSAVNELTLANAATGNSPTLSASGGDSNIDLTLTGKGTGKVVVTGDLQISGDDLYMATNTAGHLLIGDGTNYNPTAVSGDVTVSSGGVTAIGSGVIVDADVNASAAIAQSKLNLAITTSEMAAGTLVIESEGIGSNDNDTTIPTSAAVKNYVDIKATAQDLDFTTSSGSGAVDLDSQALALTPGVGIDITHSGQAVTITAEDASDLNKGIASFASADFSVSSGAVSLADLTTSHLAAAALVTESEGIGSNDNDTTLPTSAAVKDYVDTQILTEDQLSELNDTDIDQALAAGHLLIYDGTNSWDNKAVSGDISIGSDGVAAIGSGVIVNADISGSAAIADSKLATISTGNKVSGSAVQLASTSALEDSTGLRVKSALAGTGLSLASQVLSVDASQTQITAVGTIATGTWQATDIGVPYGGTGASTFTANGILLGNGTSAIAASAAMTTNGTLLIGGTGGPEVATLTAGANVTITNGDGTITIASSGGGGGASAFTDLSDVGSTTATSGRLMVADGDSWESVAVSGDATLAASGALTIADDSVTVAKMAGLARGRVIIGDSSGNPSALAAGSSGQVLSIDAQGDAVWANAMSHDGTTENGVLTYKDADETSVEANLTFDGSTLAVTGALSAGATTLGGDTVISNGYGLIVGHTAMLSIGNVGELQVLGTAAGDSSTTTARFSADSGGPSHDFLKSRNGAIGSNTIVQDDDELGGLIWYADDGNDFYSSSARIFAAVDGTVAQDRTPGRLVFATTADEVGANSATERMRIDSSGKVGINITDPADYTDASGAVLVVGNTAGTPTRSGVSIITNASGIGRLAFGQGNGDPDQWRGLIQYTQSSDTMGFATAGNAVGMTFVGQNLGIGTGSPTSPIHIKKSSTSAVSLKVQNENTSAGADRPGTILLSGAADFDGYNHAGVEFQYVDTTIASIVGMGSGSTSGTGRGGAIRFFTKADNGSNAERMRISNVGSLSLGTTAVGGSPGAGSVQFHKDANNYVRIWDNATATMYLQSNGANAPSVSLKNSDSDALEVASFQRTNAGGTILGQVRNGLQMLVGAPNGVMAIGTSNAKNLVFGTNNSPNLYLNTTGHLGVNVSDPQSLIEVSQDVDAQIDALRLTNENTQGKGAKMTFRQGDTVVGSIKADNQTSDTWAMRLGTYTKETLLALKQNGQVAVDSSVSGGHIFNVNNSNATNPSGMQIYFGGTSSGDTTDYFGIFGDSGGTRAIHYSNGDWVNANNAYGVYSSEARLKQDITEARSYWDDFKQLRYKKFRMISDVEVNPDAPYSLGLIADEVYEIFPQCTPAYTDRETRNVVVLDGDGNATYEMTQKLDEDGEIVRDEDGNAVQVQKLDDDGKPIPITESKTVDLGTTTKGIKTSIIEGPIMGRVVQELQTRLEAAEAKIVALEAA